MPKFIIEVRTKGFATAKQEIQRTSEQTRKFARDANKGKDVTATFRREVSALRNNMLLVSFAVFGTVRALGGFIRQASNAREDLNKFRTVFGDFANDGEAFARSIQSSFGIAQSNIINLLASLQDTFVPLGFTRKQASELSKSIAQLSLDVGSFQNVATADVANRFTSAIVGNHEAVRELAISLTEARIKQEAFNLGLSDGKGEISETAKILSRLNIIFNSSTDAIGDLERTNLEFANRLRATQGNLQNLSEELGEFLIPLADATLGIVDFLSNSRRAKVIIMGVATAFTVYAAGAAFAAFQTATLSAAMKTNLLIMAGTGLALIFTEIADAFGLFGEKADDVMESVRPLNEVVQDFADQNLKLVGSSKEAAEAIEQQQKAADNLKESIEKSEDALLIRLVTMQQTTELDKASTRTLINEKRALTQVEVERLNAIDNLIEQNRRKKEKIRLDKLEADTIIKENIAAQKEAIRLQKIQLRLDERNRIESLTRLDAVNAVQQEALLIQAELDGVSQSEIEKMRIKSELAQNLAKAIGGTAGSYSDYIEALNAGVSAEELAAGITEGSITNTQTLASAFVDLFNKKTELVDVTAEQDALDNLTKKNMNDIGTIAQQVSGSINALSAAFNNLGQEEMTLAQRTGQVLKVLGGLMATIGAGTPAGSVGMILSAFGGMATMAHTGGLIKQNGIQKFATGGIVQGQDNVPILAQAGEFVMQRSAVNRIGVQNLADMNSGQAPGGVTVNIQGNMIGNDEFIRDNLLPQIKRAANQELA